MFQAVPTATAVPFRVSASPLNVGQCRACAAHQLGGRSIMPDKSALDTIKARQRAWAKRSGRSLDEKGYCGCADDNVYQGRLSDAARNDFKDGGGQELGNDGERGKFQAPHSSSA